MDPFTPLVRRRRGMHACSRRGLLELPEPAVVPVLVAAYDPAISAGAHSRSVASGASSNKQRLRIYWGLMRRPGEQSRDEMQDGGAPDEQLRASESTLRSFYHSSPFLMGVVELPDDDSELIHIYDNPATQRFFGADKTEGKSARALGATPAIVALWIRHYREAQRLNQPVVFEYAHPGASGSLWLRSVVSLIGSAGPKLTRFSYITEDITQRKRAEQALTESEARFRNMADHAPVMIWMTDATGHCNYLNKAWCECTGQELSLALGTGWLEAVHDDDRGKAHDAFVLANAKHEPVRLEYRLRRKDGEYRWAIDAAAPRFDDRGEFLGYIGSVMDITERKRAEQALQDADRRKDEFLATLAHELRNPLAPMRNAVEILKLKDSPDPVATSARAMIDRQVHHMARMIDDLLDISRITRGKFELRKEHVELRPIIEQALDAIRADCTRLRHELSIRLADEPLVVEADAVRLVQVFTNLLDNACKYTPTGGRITLHMEREGDEGVVRVRDTGVGIPPEKLLAVFEMFTQIDSPQRAQRGLGIGLSLVRNLVKMHGGRVEAQSEGAARGSEFTVRLPLALESRAVAAESAAPLPAQSALLRRVLVVDDNRDAAESLMTLLQMLGSDARLAYDGREAVQAAEAFRPDAILLDIGLPELNGYEVCRRIRQERWGAQVLIIATTGWGQEADRRMADEAGFDHHLIKPVELAALLPLLRKDAAQIR